MPPVCPFLYIGSLSSLCQLLLYNTTGWNAWNRYGSVEECAVEYVERLEAERRAREAEIERLREERKAERENQRAEKQAVFIAG